MNIKIIGSGCENCNKLYKNVKSALERSGKEAVLQRVEDLIEIVKLGVMTAPSVMIDGKLVVSGRVASEDEILNILNKA